jgi:predicted HicB family RNase H-like nuclease
MEDKPKRGRPPKGQASRSARIDIRAEPSEKERYEQAAAKARLSLTEWMKARLDRAAKRELGTD